MAFHCPQCEEAQVDYLGLTDDAKSRLQCKLCGHAWLHGGRPREVTPSVLTYEQAKAQFPTTAQLTPESRSRVDALAEHFVHAYPAPEAGVAEYWEKYQGIFSEAGLAAAPPEDLKLFANTTTGAHPGNMSVFNREWNRLGDAAAADRFREVVEYLLRGDGPAVEERLTELIDPEGARGMTGLRESMLTKVLCVMEPDRFLPILIYTSDAGGKREIADKVFGLQLPRPQATSWTRGRLACWSNDLLVEALDGRFDNLQRAAHFLWWAKDESNEG